MNKTTWTSTRIVRNALSDDNGYRAEWLAAGGETHGPNVETVSMPEADYFKFRATLAQLPTVTNELVAAVNESRDALLAFADDGAPEKWLRHCAAEQRLDKALAAVTNLPKGATP